MTKLTLNLCDPDLFFLEETDFSLYYGQYKDFFDEEKITWQKVKSPLEILLTALEIDE
jgi:hypothetical protein